MVLISSAGNLYTHKSRGRSKTVEVQVRSLVAKALDNSHGCKALEEGCLGCWVVSHSHFKYGTYHHGPLLNGIKGMNSAKPANADHN